MATAEDANRLGLSTPVGEDLLTDGDDAITKNAIRFAELFNDYRMNRGTLPPDSDINTFHTYQHSGLWHINSQDIVLTITGLPPGIGNIQGELLVLMGATGLQFYFPYGYYTDAPFAWVRKLAHVGTKEFTSWQEWWVERGDQPSTLTVDVQHAIRQTQFMQAMGGPIDTAGRGAIAIRCDHGLAPFRDKVLPLTTARGIKVSQAYNPRNWHYTENQGVTASELNDWVAAGDVEIWNHSADHQDVSGVEALTDEIVNGLAEIEAELPAARGNVWGFAPPGVDGTTGWDGFGNGGSPEKWDTPAGRLILKHHAVSAAYLPGTRHRVIDGTPRDGMSHFTMDGMSVAALKAEIDAAISDRTGLQLMLHPSQLDLSGKLTTAQLTEVLDYIVAKRAAGELVTLSPYEMTIADATRPAVEVTDVPGLAERLALLEPRDLGTLHLDTVTERGRYFQPFASRATKANGYPWEGVAGNLDVDVWNPANGNMICTFKSWDRGAAKRTLYNGVWRDWLDFNGNTIE